MNAVPVKLKPYADGKTIVLNWASGFSGASLSDVPLREKTESHKGEYYTRGATLVDRTDSNTPRVYLPLKAVIASSSDRSLQCVVSAHSTRGIPPADPLGWGVGYH